MKRIQNSLQLLKDFLNVQTRLPPSHGRGAHALRRLRPAGHSSPAARRRLCPGGGVASRSAALNGENLAPSAPGETILQGQVLYARRAISPDAAQLLNGEPGLSLYRAAAFRACP